jgi:hypothetical protein
MCLKNGIPNNYVWYEATNMSVNLLNRCPTKANNYISLEKMVCIYLFIYFTFNLCFRPSLKTQNLLWWICLYLIYFICSKQHIFLQFKTKTKRYYIIISINILLILALVKLEFQKEPFDWPTYKYFGTWGTPHHRSLNMLPSPKIKGSFVVLPFIRYLQWGNKGKHDKEFRLFWG